MYAIMNIIGPILLIAVLIFVTVKTWTRTRSAEIETDRAASELREKLNYEDQTRSKGSR